MREARGPAIEAMREFLRLRELGVVTRADFNKFLDEDAVLFRCEFGNARTGITTDLETAMQPTQRFLDFLAAGRAREAKQHPVG